MVRNRAWEIPSEKIKLPPRSVESSEKIVEANKYIQQVFAGTDIQTGTCGGCGVVLPLWDSCEALAALKVDPIVFILDAKLGYMNYLQHHGEYKKDLWFHHGNFDNEYLRTIIGASQLLRCERCGGLCCPLCGTGPHREGRCVVCTDVETEEA